MPVAVKIKISSAWRSSGSKKQIKEKKIEDSVLLSLFMCSNVMVQYCPRPPSSGFSGTLIFKLTQNEHKKLSCLTL